VFKGKNTVNTETL
jgi:UV excision repair protein RAD23